MSTSEKQVKPFDAKAAKEYADKAIAWLNTEEGKEVMRKELEKTRKAIADSKKPPPTVWDAINELKQEVSTLREKCKLNGII